MELQFELIGEGPTTILLCRIRIRFKVDLMQPLARDQLGLPNSHQQRGLQILYG
jgi:hypothetical protein